MAQAQQLLRMLEPLVRPGGLPAARVQPHAPVEQQSFEQLLSEAAAAERFSVDPAPKAGSTDQVFELPDSPTPGAAPRRGESVTGDDPTQAADASAPNEARSPARSVNGDTIDDGADRALLMQRLGQLSNVNNPSVMAALGRDTDHSADEQASRGLTGKTGSDS